MDDPDRPESDQKPVPNGDGLLALYGICADTFRELGGGEAFLKAERDWGPDVWERYEAEMARMKAEGLLPPEGRDNAG